MLTELGFGEILEAAEDREESPNFASDTVDIVLCNQAMPDMSGKEPLVHLRRKFGKETPPVIFVSSLRAVHQVEEVLELQGTEHLVKPVSLRKLRRKIEGALHLATERTELSPGHIGPLGNL